MRPERAAGVVARWVGLYTRELPAPIAERRAEEIDADVTAHIAHERALGIDDRRIAWSIVSRMARGVSADVSWRRHVKTVKGDFMKPFVAAIGIGLLLAVVALVLDSPLVVLTSIGLISAAVLGALVLGLRTAVQDDFVKPFVAILATALAVAALGVSAIVFGERGDAPGLVLLGIVVITSVIVGAFQFGVRTAQRSE